MFWRPDRADARTLVSKQMFRTAGADGLNLEKSLVFGRTRAELLLTAMRSKRLETGFWRAAGAESSSSSDIRKRHKR